MITRDNIHVNDSWNMYEDEWYLEVERRILRLERLNEEMYMKVHEASSTSNNPKLYDDAIDTFNNKEIKNSSK